MPQDALSHLSLPANAPRRESRLKPKYQLQGYAEGFDDDTLWYDAIWRDGRVHLVCPKLNNLKAHVQKGQLALDGTTVKIARLRKYYRHDIIELKASAAPKRVSLSAFGTTVSAEVNAAAPQMFAGLNTALCLSKDNDLRWIVDFARYHQTMHGLEALILMDNGSETYGLQDIRDALSLTGLKQVLVLSVPWKYGPRGKAPFARTEKYLQTALFNVLRLRWLGQARAVLSCDIDELIHTPGTTVFDLAHQSMGKYVRLPGTWRYPAPDASEPALHQSHTYRATDGKRCPTKWCIVPSGPLGGFQWDTHLLEKLPLPSLFTSKKGEFWHCHAISTGWKAGRWNKEEKNKLPDPEAATVLAEVFGPPA